MSENELRMLNQNSAGQAAACSAWIQFRIQHSKRALSIPFDTNANLRGDEAL